MVDFILSHHSNRFFLQPVSLPAQRYAHEFLPRDPKHWTEAKTAVPLADLVDVLRGIHRSGLSVSGVSDQSNEEGRVGLVLAIYLAAFFLTLILFVHGHHSLAFVLLFAVWAVLAFWLHRMRRP